MNYGLISLFHSLLDDLTAGCRYEDAYQRRAASGPRNRCGGGCGIVRCPAKRAVLASVMPYGRLVCHGFVFVIDCA